MGQVRVVLYAEGTRETFGASVSDTKNDADWGTRAAGKIIPDEEQGPAQVLVRRILVEENGIPEGAIQFEEGLRDRRGLIPRGSQLLRKQTLRQLLHWAKPDLVPQLVVILVDRDGERGRREMLHGFVEDLRQPTHVIAVVREEFEAWLVADESAAGKVLKRKFERTPNPEKLERRKAKSTIDEWVSSQPLKDHPRIRREIAEHCDIGIIQSRCKAFNQFLSDLSNVTF